MIGLWIECPVARGFPGARRRAAGQIEIARRLAATPVEAIALVAERVAERFADRLERVEVAHFPLPESNLGGLRFIGGAVAIVDGLPRAAVLVADARVLEVAAPQAVSLAAGCVFSPGVADGG